MSSPIPAPLRAAMTETMVPVSDLDRHEPIFPPPVTSRERLLLGEAVRTLVQLRSPATSTSEVDALLRPFLPPNRHLLLTTQGKAAFEVTVQDAELAGQSVILPAFFPDDFVGIFRKYGIRPRFVDVNPDSYALEAERIPTQLLEECSAIVVEHTFGRPAETAALRQLCDQRGLLLIEDCARSLGAGVPGHLTGTDGDYAMFSLSKVTPVRAGGAVTSRRPIDAHLAPAHLTLGGLLHSLTLIRVGALEPIAGLIYRFAKGTSVYPLEVGNYDPAPPAELDAVALFVLRAYLGQYAAAVEKRRRLAAIIRVALEPWGYRFQDDAPGHVYTALSLEPPPGVERDDLRRYLRERGVKAPWMWEHPLGTSEIARVEWGADTGSFPVAARLGKRLLQLPISRYQSRRETALIIRLCRAFAEEHRAPRYHLAPR
ncbi:MAG: DegT/DnrJ/EryC1/StrS family aminotransferase [Dehalococcoidia bacterium]